MSQSRFKGRCLVGGSATGEALVSKKAFTFAHGVDPKTGSVTDVHSDIRGKNVRGKVLFYPFGKGSTTASAWFLETARFGNTPAAIVTEGPDLSAVIGSVLARTLYGKTIPVLSSFPRDMHTRLKRGLRIDVDGSRGELVLGT